MAYIYKTILRYCPNLLNQVFFEYKMSKGVHFPAGGRASCQGMDAFFLLKG